MTSVRDAKQPGQAVSSRQGYLTYIPAEVDEFEQEVNRFRAGEWEENAFTQFRLRRGVYGQRQPDAQMFRIKMPLGGVTAEQMDAIGRIVEEYAPLKKGHLTTRQNIQLHHIKLDDTPTIMRIIGDVGLTTREACGNTVRNVTGCARAGVAKDEIFDPTPYAVAYARYFIRHETTQNMPRKIKTAFSGCSFDCAITPIHDIGFRAEIRDGVRGFKIVAGGGLSIMPKIAPVLYDFVPADDPHWLKICEAALRIFNRSEQERKNRMKARIKFLIDRIGIDEFRRQIEEELKGEWANAAIDLPTLMEVEDESTYAHSVAPDEAPDWNASNAPEDFLQWYQSNTEEQRQPGYSLVHVSLNRGDLSPEQFSGLARVMRECGAGFARTDVQQNLVLRWIPTASLLEVYRELKRLGLNASGRHTITDVVSCPGTDSCKLGITSSMGLNEAIRQALVDYDTGDPLINEIHIKASGCPNSCGQHHIANIGFHGAVMRGQGGQVPAYELFLGGGYEDDVRMGTRIKARVPARKAPEALVQVLDFYKKERQEGERFNAFIDRVGSAPFEAMFKAYKDTIGPLNRENITTYMDWDRTVLYQLQRGEGECAV